MARYHTTSEGKKPFTEEEELEADEREAEYLAGAKKRETDRIVIHFKSIYLETVNAKLKELDYDSLATVKLWEGDETFGAEATRIITWYKAIIDMNYKLITDITNGIVEVPSDTEYKAMVDGMTF